MTNRTVINAIADNFAILDNSPNATNSVDHNSNRQVMFPNGMNSQDFYPWVSIFTLVFNSILGSIGNSIVVTVYGLKRNKNASEIFILQLACLDLTVAALYMPVSVFQIVTNSQSSIICLIDKGGAFSYVTASFVMFFCIATDRLIAVNKPHAYKTIMNSRRVKLLSTISIVTGVVFGVPIGISCFTESTADDLRNLNYFTMFYSAAVILLVLFLSGAYINVFIVARKTLTKTISKDNRGALQLQPKSNISYSCSKPQSTEVEKSEVDTSNLKPASSSISSGGKVSFGSKGTSNVAGKCIKKPNKGRLLLTQLSRGSFSDAQVTQGICMSSLDKIDNENNNDIAVCSNTDDLEKSSGNNNISNSKMRATGSVKYKVELKKATVNGMHKMTTGTNVKKSNKKEDTESDESGDNESLNAQQEHMARMKRDRNVRKQWQIAITLFLVTFVFIGCYAPSAILDLEVWHEFLKIPRLNMRVEEILFAVLWYSVPANPVIYGFTSPRFRKETRLLLNRMKICPLSANDAI